MPEQMNQLQVIEENLSGLIEKKIGACPKGFNKTRFLQNCLAVLRELDKTKLAKLTPESIAATMIKGAFLGLDFFNRECYAIPFGNELQFLTDYKGDMKLCKQYSVKPIKNIYAKLVREGDAFNAQVIDGLPIINFAPIAFSDKEVIGAFAVVLYEDGALDYAVMSKKEIQETRMNWSKCPNSPAWVKAEGEMYKKTVTKRVCKVINVNFDNAEQDKAFREGADLKLPKEIVDVSPEVRDPFKKEPSEEEPKKEETNPDAIIAAQNQIEKFLVEKGKQPSLIYKYSIDICKKKLSELTLEEMLGLKDKILNGKI